MEKPDLQPGDFIVPLADLTRQAAFLTGAITAAILTWILRHNFIYSLFGFIAGLLVGFIVGGALGSIFFPSTADNIIVVKAGPDSLPKTMKAALLGAMLTAVLVGLVALPFANSFELRRNLLFAALITGAIIGIASSLLASLA